jgi:DNA-binding NarL/FixJ family response regulator
LQIVCEVSDGQDAVRKAGELRPDLILLDVGLPSLNGIADVVQEALRIGAPGYVVKVNAASDLLPAVEAVCQGERFVSAGLAGQVPAELVDGEVSKRVHQHEVLGSPPETGN